MVTKTSDTKNSISKNTSKNTAQALSYADAAEQVLREKKKPLSYRDIAKHAVASGVLISGSQTPEISMHVSLQTEIRRRDQRGEPQRFVFLGNGMFALVEQIAGAKTEKTRSAIDQVKDSRDDAKKALYEALTATNQGSGFELMVSDLLVAMGYEEVEVIGGKDDQGVDILCEKHDGIIRTRIAIQCKCKNKSTKIGPRDVSTLRDNLSSYQCQQGILVTTTTLNDDAKNKAKEPGKEPIQYIEHDGILDLFAQYRIGMRVEELNYFQMDASAYDFLSGKKK